VNVEVEVKSSTHESGSTTQEVPIHVRQVLAQLAVIEAISAGRFDEARRALDELVAQCPIAPGRCRYCGCTTDSACALVTYLPSFAGDGCVDALEGVIARCHWVDDDQTVCSNLSCMERWEREHPVIVSASPNAAAGASRIVLP
jgi:hypothetical protein